MPINPANLNAVASAGSGILGSVASIINTNKTNKANRELAEYSYQKDLEMWNRQNAYNDPSAQMARYQGAGLNPNLIYGSGSASAGNSASMPRYQAPSMQYHYEAPNVAPTIGAYLDTKAKNAQIQSINEDVTAKRLQNQITTASLLSQITAKNQMGRTATLKADQDYYRAGILNWQSNYAPEYFNAQTQQAIEGAKSTGIKNSFLAKLLEQQLKNSVMANTLQGKTLERYSADITGANLSNEYKRLQNEWYGNAGIHSAKDILPFIESFMKYYKGAK